MRPSAVVINATCPLSLLSLVLRFVTCLQARQTPRRRGTPTGFEREEWQLAACFGREEMLPGSWSGTGRGPLYWHGTSAPGTGEGCTIGCRTANRS